MYVFDPKLRDPGLNSSDFISKTTGNKPRESMEPTHSTRVHKQVEPNYYDQC